MNEKALIDYYVKFNENKRLTTKHSQVEFRTAIKYIDECLNLCTGSKILDVGAGTGHYSGYYFNMGCEVTAVELVKHNLRTIEKNYKGVKAVLGNALNLSKFENDSFDVVLLFGPMYHLISLEEKVCAMKEAKRVLKPGGFILVSYCMNEYAVMTHGFVENNIKKSIDYNKLDDEFHVISGAKDLYSYVRIDDINEINKLASVERFKIVNQDGFAEYNKKLLNEMNRDIFEEFINYHFSICEKPELLGFGRHILDIIIKNN